VLIAFADGTGLEQNRPGPSLDRPEGGPTFLHEQHRNHSFRTSYESFGPANVPAANTGQGFGIRGDLDFSTCSRAGGGLSTDQNRRGGIDLHIEIETAERATLANELKFSNELKDRIGDQRIDVVVRGPSYKLRAIDEIEERHRTENNPAAFGTSTTLSLASGRKTIRLSDAVRAVLDSVGYTCPECK
jgi:hypothetical protein